MRTGVRTSRPRRGWAAAVAVLVALPLGGCSGGADGPTGKPSGPSASSAAVDPSGSPAPSGSSSTEAPPAAPAPAEGAAGRRAFARHVIDLWTFALRTNDARPLVALGRGKPCGGCPALRRELDRRSEAGWTVDLQAPQVRSVKLGRRGDALVARAVVDIPESDSVNADGSFRNANPAHGGATFETVMRFAGGRYRLLSFTVS